MKLYKLFLLSFVVLFEFKYSFQIDDDLISKSIFNPSTLKLESLTHEISNLDNLINNFFESVNNLYQRTLEDSKTYIKPYSDCYKGLSKANLEEGFIYILKFFTATTFYNNNLNSFKSCKDNVDGSLNFIQTLNQTYSIDYNVTENLTYVILYPESLPEFNKVDIRYKTYTNVLGMCIHKFCDIDEYKYFIFRFNENTDKIMYNFTSENNASDAFETFKNNTILIKIDEVSEYSLFAIIPVIILFLFLLLTFCPSMLKLCFCCFKKTPKRKTINKDPNSTISWKFKGTSLNINKNKNNQPINSNDSNIFEIEKKRTNFVNEEEIINTDNINNNLIVLDEPPKQFNFNYFDENESYEENEDNDENMYEDFSDPGEDRNKVYIRYKKSILGDTQIDFQGIEDLINKLWIKNNILKFFESLKKKENDPDSVLEGLNGLRAIAIIFAIFGWVYYNIFSSPFKIYNARSHETMIKNFSISWILFGLRYSRKIFYAISGYTLVYKFLCYLDSLIEKRKSNNNFNSNNNNFNSNIDKNSITNPSILNSPEKNKENIIKTNELKESLKPIKSPSKEPTIEFYETDESGSFSDSESDSSDEDSKVSDDSKVSEEEEEEPTFSTNINDDLRKNLSFKDYLRFVFTQLHKYILFILCISIFKYSYFSIKSTFFLSKPLFYKLRNILENISNWTIISVITLIPIKDNPIFLTVINEIRFFLIYSFIIYFGYKFKARIDYFLFVMFILCILYKIIVLSLYRDTMHPALFHYSDSEKNELFYSDTNFSHSFFILGIFFGKAKYLIQKSIKTKEKLIKKGKNFLLSTIWFSNFFNKLKSKKRSCLKKFLVIISLILVLFFICSYSIFYNIFDYNIQTNNLRDFNDNLVFKYFYLLDNEFFIFFLMFLFMLLTDPGKNVFNSVLRNENWKFITKPYISILCFYPMVLLDFIHHANYRIRIDFFNMIFYSNIAFTILLFLSILSFVLVEMPLKNLIKFIIQRVK